jgi:hypothetical protein
MLLFQSSWNDEECFGYCSSSLLPISNCTARAARFRRSGQVRRVLAPRDTRPSSRLSGFAPHVHVIFVPEWCRRHLRDLGTARANIHKRGHTCTDVDVAGPPRTMLRLCVLLTLLVSALASAVSKRNFGPETVYAPPSSYAVPRTLYARSLMLNDVRRRHTAPRSADGRCRARARCWRRGRTIRRRRRSRTSRSTARRTMATPGRATRLCR